MKILFAGGGTGGHLFSGVAVAEAFLAKGPEGAGSKEKDLLFVGTSYGLENELIPKLGHRLELIPVSQLKGKGFLPRLKALLQLPYSFFKSLKLLIREKPDLVMGIGGYASGPVTLTAYFLGIKTTIIEQNSHPGITNRILGKFVDLVFIAFEKARVFFPPSRTVLTGNPVRRGFLDHGRGGPAWPPANDGRPHRGAPTFTLLVLGGSQGARSINQAVTEAAALFAEEKDSKLLRLIHQTGKADSAWVREAYEKAKTPAEVFDFIQDMKAYYARADLVVSRAGAGTITELENMGKAAILVPYPYAADDHQRTNAEELLQAGAARMILNSELSGARLFQEIRDLRKDPAVLLRMEAEARRLAKPRAAEEILNLCEKLVLGG